MTKAYGTIDGVQVVANATIPSSARPPREPFVFAAGRWWDAGKGVETLDAAAEFSRWPVVLAGALSGPGMPSVTLRHARTAGELSAEAVRDHMSRATIFVSTALYEPFGLAVLEAAASGTALVLADIPTFRELWDGAAVFVAPRDAAGFGAAINDLAQSRPQRKAMGERAAARARDFTPARQVEQVQRIYARTLAMHSLAA